MIHGTVYLLFAAELAWVMSASPVILAPLGYPIISFLVAGLGFLSGQPAVFGKKPDGHFQTPLFLLHLPFHGMGWLAAGLRKLRDTHHPYDEIVPGLWLGERTQNLPEGVELLVDLTAEHSRIDVSVNDYLLIATLDGQAPDLDALAHAIKEIESSPRCTYVHCWAGKGRSATLVAGLLIAKELAKNADDAEQYLQARRPIVKLSKSQHDVVNQYAMRSRNDVVAPD